MNNQVKCMGVIIFTLFSQLCLAQEDTRHIQLHHLLDSLHRSNAFNGNVLVAEKGKVIYQESFGLADEKSKRKIDHDTAFELASVSKQFTAMAIILLQKQGKLSYSDEVSKYVPELAAYKGITLHHLLVHTSGLPDYMALAVKYWNKNDIATNASILKLFEQVKPEREFQPNEKWEYSDTGYLVLATVIERVSKSSFNDFLKQNIFMPLGMNRTFIYQRRYEPMQIKNYAEGYIYSDSLKRKILPDELGNVNYEVFLDGVIGDGMVNSTTEDLLKWDRALYTDQLIDDNDKKLVFSSHDTSTGQATAYGYGWFIENSEKYGKVVSHSGDWAGYITYIERHIDRDKTIIILQNNSLESTVIPVPDICKIVYGE